MEVFYVHNATRLIELIYNTTLPGYGNYGHYFGDKLTGEERKAVIEYLKTVIILRAFKFCII